MTGMQYLDLLHDAYMLSGGAPPLRRVCALRPAQGIALHAAARTAARAAASGDLLSAWLWCNADAFRLLQIARFPDLFCAAQYAGSILRKMGAVVFPAAVEAAQTARTVSDWSAQAYAGGVRAFSRADEQEMLFLAVLKAAAERSN